MNRSLTTFNENICVPDDSDCSEAYIMCEYEDQDKTNRTQVLPIPHCTPDGTVTGAELNITTTASAGQRAVLTRQLGIIMLSYTVYQVLFG